MTDVNAAPMISRSVSIKLYSEYRRLHSSHLARHFSEYLQYGLH